MSNASNQNDPQMTSVALPFAIQPAEARSPRNMIIMSKPKTGKTSIVSQLPHCLLLDLENGSNYVSALKMKVSSIWHLQAIGQQILSLGQPYRFIAIDTTTALEEMCIPLAEELYKQTPMGKNWGVTGGGKDQYKSILNLPNGAGYPYLRQAYSQVRAFINSLAPNIIELGHVKETVLDKNGIEVNALDLDLTGKLKRIATSESDAIGYLYRKGSQNILSFVTKDTVACGTRAEHLSDQEIVISEKINGQLVTYWHKVYLELPQPAPAPQPLVAPAA